MRFVLSALILASAMLAQQSAIYTGTNYHINSTFTPQAIDYRVDARLHNWTLPGSGMTVFELQWIGVKVAIYSSGQLYCASTRDGGTLLEVGTNFLSGKTDVIIRIQRVAADNRLYCEARTTDLTEYASASQTITGSTGYSNVNYTRAVIGGYMATSTIPDGQGVVRFDYMRVSSTTLPLGSRMSWQDTALGTIASWEFEGDATARLTDSTGGKTLTAVSSPTYAASLTGTPTASPRGDNTTIFSQAPLKAGQINTLGNWSICRNNSPCSSYFWTQTGGPSTLSWSSRTSATPAVTGVVATTGTDYTIRLVTTDTSGAKSTVDLALGAVALDSNNIVILPSAIERNILGSIVAFGSNPWTFVDFNQQQFSDVYIDRLATLSTYQNYWDTAQAGTVSVNNASSTVTGSGTAFQTLFSCAPGTGNTAASGDNAQLTWVSGPTYTAGLVGAQIIVDGLPSSVLSYVDSTHIIISGGFGTRTGKATQIQEAITFWYPHADGSSGRRDYKVSTCSSNTSLTITSGPSANTWDKSNLVAANYSRTATGYSWADDSPNFYDVIKGLWAMYRRTGLSKYKTASRSMARLFYYQPYWDMQEWALTGEYRYPRLQAAAGLWLNYHDDNSIFDANFPTRMGYVTTDAISRETGYLSEPVTDTREFSYMMQAAQYVANWHPTGANRTAAQAFVDALITKFSISQGAAGGFPTTGNITTTTTFAPENGNPIVPASGAIVPAGFCSTPAYSTGTVSFSGTTMTGSGTAWDSSHLKKQIEVYVSGLSGADSTWRSYVVSVDSATQITMAHSYNGSNTTGRSYALFTGASNGYKQVQFGTSRFVQDSSAYTCTRNSDTQITLSRPYEGTTGTGKGYWSDEFPGTGYQPLTNNIAVDAMTTVVQYAGATSAATAATYRTQIMDYLQREGDGYIELYKGTSYWNPSARCGADVTKDLMCSGFGLGTVAVNRDIGLDGIAPIASAYLAAPTEPRLARADEFYTAAFALPGYASPVAGDGSTAGIMLYNSDNYLKGKAYGQPYGVGNAAAWPAARLGGVAPLSTATKSIKARLADISGAASIVVDFLAADGTLTTSAACTSAACTISADTRQGYQYRVRYLSAGAATLATGGYAPVQ
jgi:hypothetical protein